MKDKISASVTLNEDLNLIYNRAYTWKMSFNSNLSKQAKEIIFSKKQSNIQLPVLTFNKKPTSAATISHVKPPLVWEEGRLLEQTFWKFTEAIF